MGRPSARDAAILSEVARHVLAAMPAGMVSVDDEEVLEAIRSVLEDNAPRFDEYRMTRDLESKRLWDCDSEVMDAFEVASSATYSALREATKAWVISNGIKPRLALGDQVTINTWVPGKGRRDLAGEIMSIEPDQATYTVMIPSLGHVREGIGTPGQIVKFEDLHSIVPPVEEYCLSAG